MAFVWISLGAVVGANARYLVGPWVAERLGLGFPYGTLIVNASGSLLLGLVLGLLSWRMVDEPAWRLALAVGFCGSYTTFSAFSYETLELLREGALGAAVLYVAASVALSLAAVAAGLVLARAV